MGIRPYWRTEERGGEFATIAKLVFHSVGIQQSLYVAVGIFRYTKDSENARNSHSRRF